MYWQVHVFGLRAVRTRVALRRCCKRTAHALPAVPGLAMTVKILSLGSISTHIASYH